MSISSDSIDSLYRVDSDEISSKTIESTKAKGLYFIGEVLDVTSWLSGHSFQWAWSSGWCAGQVV